MSDKQLKSNMPSVPIWKKMNLTVEEASEYSGIGTSKIKELSGVCGYDWYGTSCWRGYRVKICLLYTSPSPRD